jgi:hypothetical protein
MFSRISAILFVFVFEMAWACATCYGDPDAPVTQGLNGAIWTLLIITGGVLSSIVVSIISIRNKSKTFMKNQNN